MRDVRYSLIVPLLLNCVSTTGYAQVSYGMGTNSCGQYLSAVHGRPPGQYRWVENAREGKFFDEHRLYMEWLLGFVDATNWSISAGAGRNFFTDPAAIDVWMRKWCEQNPTKTVSEAAWAFTQDQRR